MSKLNFVIRIAIAHPRPLKGSLPTKIVIIPGGRTPFRAGVAGEPNLILLYSCFYFINILFGGASLLVS